MYGERKQLLVVPRWGVPDEDKKLHHGIEGLVMEVGDRST